MEPTFGAGDYTLRGDERPSSEDVSSYLGVLVRLAALDGLEVSEKTFVQRVGAALGIDCEVAVHAHQLADDESVSTEALVARIRDKGLRLCLLRDAYRLAAVDSVVSDSEIRELAVIAKALGIERNSAAAVRSIALQEVRLQREFAKMVSEARA